MRGYKRHAKANELQEKEELRRKEVDSKYKQKRNFYSIISETHLA